LAGIFTNSREINTLNVKHVIQTIYEIFSVTSCSSGYRGQLSNFFYDSHESFCHIIIDLVNQMSLQTASKQ